MNYKEVIESKYNRENWQILLHDIFGNKIKFWNTPSPVQTNSQFARKALWLGTITLSDEQTIAVYEVELSDNVDIERNRRGIRDMLLSSWRNNGNAGAFMFCYRKHESVLRFSYVSESWTFGEDGTYKKESTDTKRFTYLLGEGHRSRTAIQQFEKLRDSSLSLKDLTKAFSVDAVSDMFFKGYKQQYEDIIYYVTGKRMVKVSNKWEEQQEGTPNAFIMQQFAKFPNPEKAVRDYVKKLMGRLVFLQFLQKKGWLGVPVDKEWGEGDSEFIQTLFAECKDKDHFIDNELESLFNDLNSEEQKELTKYRTPYLNGGLFERDASDETEFPLPAKYMQSLLDFFASNNFTIDENDPDDAEVGVDPEMLGRIFENLLEDNKDKGAFYTPKEIVSYMCRESLIAYLQTDIEDEATKEAIRQFVTTHNSKHLGSKASPLWGRLEGALRDVKICDPAIGSGAFPMGLLKELFQCRTALEGIEQNKASEIKKHIIQQNIYGVDIERGAVDIARLRFWLSLIVDEETPQALPNLDFKIMQGNSLLEQYKGVDLSTMTEKKYDKKEGLSWFDDMVDVYRKELCDMLAKYYNCTDHKEKKELRTNIINNVKKQLAEQRINIDFGDLDLSGNDQFFLWHTWFYDVFSQGGFDIVIGNPPYIDSETMMKSMPEVRELYKMIFGTAKGNWDIYVIFFEHGMKLLNDSGTLSFITPNKWISIGYGKTLRDIFFEEIFSLCDCQKIKVFEAGNEPVISIFSKKKPKDINISRFENNYNCHIIQTISKQRIGKDNLGMCISKNFPILANIMKQDKTVGDYIKVENPFSTSEAYELIELLKDHNTSQDFKLINTGTIDPYVSLWGIKTTSYLKGKYIYPTVNRSAFKTKFPKRERQASSPKIIITGMRYFECYYDCDGSYIAGKSTIILLNPQKKELFKLLLGILNSKLIAFYIRGSYSTLGIGGGINFSRDMVEGLPIPILSTESEKIILCVEKVLQAKRGNINSDISALESEIDRLVYQLYGLTDEEIRIVEGKN